MAYQRHVRSATYVHYQLSCAFTQRARGADGMPQNPITQKLTSKGHIMKAVGFTHYLPITDPASFLDVELSKPIAKGRDILVAVKAVAVNPVDVKVRAPKDKVESQPRIIGYDAAGIVESVGP